MTLQFAQDTRNILAALPGRVKDEERQFNGAAKKTLLEIAELTLNPRLPEQETREAIAVLAKYRLAVLADRSRPITNRELIGKERQKPYTRRCARCGPKMLRKYPELEFARLLVAKGKECDTISQEGSS